jgi:4-hydroxy-tetrahydrodipicolinate synthase
VTQSFDMLTMAATPFTPDGKIDEGGLRAHLQRLVNANNGVYLAGGGAGEGHALSPEELRRVCEIGVEECKGKVPTYCNPREGRSAEDVYRYAREAVAAGVDMVQIYQVEAGHGMHPTPIEQNAYFRELLEAIDYPVAISIHHKAGFHPSPEFLATLKKYFPQIQAINVMGMPVSFFVELRDVMPTDVRLYTGAHSLGQWLALGASGCLQAEGNIIPKSCRALIDTWALSDIQGFSRHTEFFVRFSMIVNKWAPSTARWVKMALRVLDLPGGKGPLRLPYIMPEPDEQQRMLHAFKQLGVREVERL